MRILFLTDNFPPEVNAPATRTWDHVQVWAALGHQVTVITTAPNFPRGKVFEGYRNAWRSVEVRQGIRIVRVKTYIAANRGTLKRMLDYLSFMAAGTIAALFERRPDVIVATSPQFFTAVAGWMVSLLRWRPWVFELRDLWPDSIIAVGAMKPNLGLRAVEKLELFLYRRAARVVSVTHAFRQNLIDRGIDSSKIDVVTNGVNLDTMTPRTPGAALAEKLGLTGKFVAAYIGTHGMAHALDRVLDTAELVSDRQDIRFLLVGDGAAKPDLVKRAASMPNVVLMDPQPRDQIPDLWALANVALVPLRDTPTFETVIPSKIFEAMAMARPVLASIPTGEATDLVNQHQAGMVVPPEDTAAMAKAICDLADDIDLCVRLGANGRKAAAAYHRPELAKVMIASLTAAAQSIKS